MVSSRRLSIGLDPCMFLGPILNIIAGVIEGAVAGIQNTINGIAQLPQNLVDQLQAEIQGEIEDLFDGVDMSLFTESSRCAGVTGMLNEVFQNNVDTGALIGPIENTVNDVTIGNVALDARLTAGGL